MNKMFSELRESRQKEEISQTSIYKSFMIHDKDVLFGITVQFFLLLFLRLKSCFNNVRTRRHNNDDSNNHGESTYVRASMGMRGGV